MIGRFLGRVFSAFWMLLWISLMTWFGWWMAAKGWYLMGHDWPLVGLGVVLAALVLLAVCVRGVWLVLMLLAGHTTPNLARRDFRNSMANLLMSAKTGLWKE